MQYDFDPQGREGIAEFATRTINAISHPGVSPFRIIGGYIPQEVLDQIKSPNN